MTTAKNPLIPHLNGLLADGEIFYRKLRSYHWTVAGPAFFQLHAQFEEVYTQWALLIDGVAERVVALGGRPLPTFAASIDHAKLQEDNGTPDASTMVKNLVQDLSHQRETAQTVAAEAERTNDRITVALLDGLLEAIEDRRWMLQAYLRG